MLGSALDRAAEHSTPDHCVPGFETQCVQVWGPFILHLVARRPVRRS